MERAGPKGVGNVFQKFGKIRKKNISMPKKFFAALFRGAALAARTCHPPRGPGVLGSNPARCRNFRKKSNFLKSSKMTRNHQKTTRGASKRHKNAFLELLGPFSGPFGRGFWGRPGAWAGSLCGRSHLCFEARRIREFCESFRIVLFCF